MGERVNRYTWALLSSLILIQSCKCVPIAQRNDEIREIGLNLRIAAIRCPSDKLKLSFTIRNETERAVILQASSLPWQTATSAHLALTDPITSRHLSLQA